jgi:hypothetical protein
MSRARLAAGWLVLSIACARSGPSAPAEASAGGTPAEPSAGMPAPAAPQSPAPARPPEAALPASDGATSDLSRFEKTAGITAVRRPGGPRVLHAVRAATAAGYDRVVFEFRDAVPGFHLEYVDRPIRDCGAGDVKPVEGDGWLEARFFPANAHTEAGQPTVAERELLPRLPIVREIERTCDFEAVVTWVVGTASPNRYRAFELRDPPRLVIDIDH